MRDPKRIPIILKEIEKFWSKYPDLRLGQIITNCNTLLSENDNKTDLFYLEDEKLIEGLQLLDKFSMKEKKTWVQTIMHVIQKIKNIFII